MGLIQSGALGTTYFSSGAVVNHSQEVVPLYSGGLWTILTGERVSGVRAVTISSSGFVSIAMAAVSGRSPAVGIVDENVESGIQCNVHVVKFHQFASGLANFSGYLGYRVFLGRSGQVNVWSGSWNSGGYASGDVGQPLGTVINSGGVLFNVNPLIFSGGPGGIATGGNK